MLNSAGSIKKPARIQKYTNTHIRHNCTKRKEKNKTKAGKA